MSRKQSDKDFVLSCYPEAKAVRRQIYAGTKMYGWCIEGIKVPTMPIGGKGEAKAWEDAAQAIRAYGSR